MNRIELWIELLVMALLVGLAYALSIKRARRLQTAINAPPTPEEKAQEPLPNEFTGLSREALVSGLRSDLISAEAYLESAEDLLNSTKLRPVFGLLTMVSMYGEKTTREDLLTSLFNDLMQADQFINAIRQRLKLLEMESPSNLTQALNSTDKVTLDWGYIDLATYAQLAKLKPQVKELRQTVKRLMELTL